MTVHRGSSRRLGAGAHLDFRPDDRDAEVDRLLSLGATRAEIGQGERSWVVLVDPEGNEFCVLGSRTAANEPPMNRLGVLSSPR